MPKKNKFESFVYHLFRTLDDLGVGFDDPNEETAWDRWIESLKLEYVAGSVRIDWVDTAGAPGSVTESLSDFEFYVRGDDERYQAKQFEKGVTSDFDAVKDRNRRRFLAIIEKTATLAGFSPDLDLTPEEAIPASLRTEERFHDEWASSADIEHIDVRKVAEAVTSPELRYISEKLGDLRGKKLLDVGCGLGEAGVYFALQGADVTLMDLSQGMLDAAAKLARAHGVTVKTHKSAAESTLMAEHAKFDIVYAGNVLHHVDIDKTLRSLKSQLAPDGVFVSWDPLAYNPVINVYRRIATKVRTKDEHPLNWSDIKAVRRHFGHVETRYFWLTTLTVFIIMAVIQRRNPNGERFWKSVVLESDRWAPIYRPLEYLDRLLLTLIPPLRLLCWNVVIIATE